VYEIRPWIKAVMSVLIVIAFWGGLWWGERWGAAETTARLQREAAKAQAAKWVTGENGAPEFKWLACVVTR
jgi:hypothetical protein